MPNCKPGDLAIIHGLIEDTEFNGLVVTVTQAIKTDIGISWRTMPKLHLKDGHPAMFADPNLFPIRGASTPTKQKLDTPIPATVL